MLAGEKYWQKWKGHARTEGVCRRSRGMDRLRDQDSRPQPGRRTAPRRRGRNRAGATCRAACGEPPRSARNCRHSGARTASDARGDPAATLSHAGRSGPSSAGLAPLVRRRAGPLVSAAETLEDSIRLTVDRVGEGAGGRYVGLSANFLARSRVRAHGLCDPPAGALARAGFSQIPRFEAASGRCVYLNVTCARPISFYTRINYWCSKENQCHARAHS